MTLEDRLLFHLVSRSACRGYLAGTRLLSFSSNVEQRLYPQWAVRVLQTSALPKGECYQTNDPIEQTVSM